MGKALGRYGWLKHVAVVVVYTLLYVAIRPLSDAHWALSAGLRLAWVLVLPTRYWTALAVADFLPMAYQSYACEDQFGMAWALVYSIPQVVIAMPIVGWCRTQLGLFPSKRQVNFNVLLICVLLVSAAWALLNFAAIAVSKQPTGNAIPLDPVLIVYLFTGKYIALLTVIPWVVIAKLEYRSGTLIKQLRSFAGSRLALDAALILIPSVLILSWLSIHGKEVRQTFCLFMFLPVAWMTLKHGWRATILGGTIVVAAICLLLPTDTPDPVILQTQAIIAFAITCLFALGARITAMDQQREHEQVDTRRVLHLARQSINIGEIRLRQASESLEHVSGELQLSHDRILNRFRNALPFDEGQGYRKQVETTRQRVYQLANSMHPIAWRERGLPAALNETIGRALDEAAITYHCTMHGRGLAQLAPSAHSAIYRLACESVAYISAQLKCSEINLQLRGCEMDGSRLAILRVEGRVGELRQDEVYSGANERDRLASKLGAVGLDLIGMRDHVRIFGGELHVRSDERKLRITCLINDASKKEREPIAAPAPLRLWVR
ncbi:MAG: MASE1 domain-containing protein [Rhodanobacter sp.]